MSLSMSNPSPPCHAGSPRLRGPSPHKMALWHQHVMIPPTSSGSVSSHDSPASTPAYSAPSLQTTPELCPRLCPSMPPPLSLPDAVVSPPSSASPPGPRAGLIRRVSRNAQQIPGRLRRTASAANRDSSSWPILDWRRAGKGAADPPVDVSDLELNPSEEDAIEDGDMPPPASAPAPAIAHGHAPAVAPIRYARLEQGTVLRKITKKKRKDVVFRLDYDSAKVCWESKQLYIDDIREIRVADEARNYRDECQCPDTDEPLWFTIVYWDPARSKGHSSKTMHLVAADVAQLDLWTRSLHAVSRHRIELMAGLLKSGETSAELVWQRAMDRKFAGADHADKDEQLDFGGVLKLCRSLHINCAEAKVRFHFAASDEDHSKTLNRAQFLHFVRALKKRRDVKVLFKDMTRHAPLDRNAFFAFLRAEQGVDVHQHAEHWASVFDKFARTRSHGPAPDGDGPLTMGLAAFQAFLCSPANFVYAPASDQPHFDRPLNEYFVSSSHNTYLLGRQVAGESSTEAYISALKKGCRCVEVDCWDGSDGEPIVMHGRTFTKSIPFRETIKVIAQYAFCESPYPLIVSLEVHCSAKQQDKMVRYMKDEFGDKLVLLPLSDDCSQLPSPEQLRNRILIKVKAAAVDDEGPSRRQRSASSPQVRSTVDTMPATPLSSPPSISPSPTLTSSAEDSDAAHGGARRRTPKATSKITAALGELGVYTKGVKFSDFRSPDAAAYNHVFSIGERTFDRLCKAKAASKLLLEDHNVTGLMRVYPGNHRVNSSNFDPLRFWRRGVQMAALNWQTFDLGQQVNEAMFAAGDDRLGYVLKPDEMRLARDAAGLGLGLRLGFPASPKRKEKTVVRFSVDIISAQQLPRPKGLSQDANINPYVEFEMYSAEDKGPVATGQGGEDASARNGESGIGQPLRKRTRIVDANGYDPVFNETVSMTLLTRYPSLVFVRWSVWNSADGRRSSSGAPLATFTAKLSSLQQGYRHLPLFDVNGDRYLFSTLFCKIRREDWSPATADIAADDASAVASAASSAILATPPPGPEQSPKNGGILRHFFRAPSQRRRRYRHNSELDLPAFSPSSTTER